MVSEEGMSPAAGDVLFAGEWENVFLLAKPAGKTVVMESQEDTICKKEPTTGWSVGNKVGSMMELR